MAAADAKLAHTGDLATEAAIAAGVAPGISRACIVSTVHTHDQLGLDYPWLEPKFGKLLWVDFEEPAGSGVWKTYNRFFWGRHAALVPHDPDRLVEAHMDMYVRPATRRIRLRFFFERPADGLVYWMHPTKEFYELEAAYFRRHGLCEPHGPCPSPMTATTHNAEAERAARRFRALARLPGLAPHLQLSEADASDSDSI